MNRDFWKYWIGETISNFGNSVTQFALPLVVFKLTGSALALGATLAIYTAPQLFFGLAIGAWTDRTDRKRLMIVVDILSAITIASVAVAAGADLLSVWWIYAVVFVSSTLSIFFVAAEFGAIPSLVDSRELVSANGRIQASFAAASVLGPLAAGALLVFLPVEKILLLDAASFVASAVMLSSIARPFNAPITKRATSIRQDIVEGLRYVLSHPVLRNISLMMALINMVSATVFAELVLFAKQALRAEDSEVGLLFAAGGAGVVVLSLAAGPLRKRWSFGNVALGALMLSGLLTVGFAYTTSLWIAIVLWGLISGLGILFNINTGSLRQAIVPNQMLGRVISIAMVLAWSANPIGALVGGLAIERTGDVRSVYAVVGIAVFVIAFVFRMASPLGSAERYLTPNAGAAAKRTV
ncbi:MAG TPA: MFS transporter [Candidatus Limnocylindria bacterium]|nr:MFS transporter [Candidatus Limnocylindria bacterium]